MWEKRIRHDGLNAYRVVKGQTQADVELKSALQEAIWTERWRRKLDADRVRATKTRSLEQRSLTVAQNAAAKALALEHTKELESERDRLSTILGSALGHDPSIDWEQKKEQFKFGVPKPSSPPLQNVPPQPGEHDSRYVPDVVTPKVTLFNKIVGNSKRIQAEAAEQNARLSEDAKALFRSDEMIWKTECQRVAELNAKSEGAHMAALTAWQSSRQAFEQVQQRQHEEVEVQKARYLSGDDSSLLSYVEDVLSQSDYPDAFPREQRLQYLCLLALWQWIMSCPINLSCRKSKK